MVHLCSGIANDFYALRQKLVSVLMMEVVSRCISRGFLHPSQKKEREKARKLFRGCGWAAYQAKERGEL